MLSASRNRNPFRTKIWRKPQFRILIIFALLGCIIYYSLSGEEIRAPDGWKNQKTPISKSKLKPNPKPKTKPKANPKQHLKPKVQPDSSTTTSNVAIVPQSDKRKPAKFPERGDGARDAQFVSFGDQTKLPTTQITVHVPGWTVFENLYLFNGTMFVVTDEPKKIPDIKLLTSSGAWNVTTNTAVPPKEREPTDKDMQIITPRKAEEIFGSHASWMDGTSFIATDPHPFVHHYYHWCAEVFFGLWRTYSLLDPTIDSNGHTNLTAPRRIMLPHVQHDQFRDRAGLTHWFTQAVFPAVSFEFQQSWEDRAAMMRPFLLERAVLGDREATMHDSDVAFTRKTGAALFGRGERASPYWWSTIRNSFAQFVGHDFSTENRKVITYVSRQTWNRRKLKEADHNGLVTALRKLADENDYELNIVSMEHLTRDEQIRLAARTTIMMGVHGNGLTALLWMKPSKRATVIEFFYPGGFAQDYGWTTRALGMKHYGFWGKEFFTAPQLPPRAYPEGFQGNEIPIYGDAVARLCHERLSLPDSDD
ncbi:hypothetical protein M422DRAFT_223717 [Sphaerobolus stellatus SS14]|nr:hypothetical protein M422DRAFT_223717 [Sphaerobolus stellatus SS14]